VNTISTPIDAITDEDIRTETVDTRGLKIAR
jgi:hypothetical protein